MINIRELSGLIKYFTSQGIVEKVGVECISDWIDRNKNLVYEDEIANFLKSIEEILIIDDENDITTRLSEVAEEFFPALDAFIEATYELSGILKGMQSYEEIGESSIQFLCCWCRDYKTLILEKDIYGSVAKFLVDFWAKRERSTISSTSLDDLLDIISKVQTNFKIGILCNEVSLGHRIGVELVRILSDESVVEEVYRRGEAELQKTLESYSGISSRQERIFLALVLVGMINYDGDFYAGVRKQFSTVYDRYNANHIEGNLRDVLKRFKREKVSYKRAINIALESTLVPENFLPAFFEFIFDIYKVNFQHSLPENIREEFSFVFDSLKGDIDPNTDEILIKATRKTHKLIATTKRLLAKPGGIDDLVNLSIIVAKLIDKRVWGDRVKIFNPYLKKGYEVWEQIFAEGEQRRERVVRSRSGSAMRSSWQPQLRFKNEAIYVVPPSHKVRDNYNYRDIKVEVWNQGELLYSNEKCDIREIVGGYQINPPEIETNKPLGALTYQVWAGKELLYHSQDILFRTMMVFDESGYEIKNYSDFEGTVYVCSGPEEVKLSSVVKTSDYNVGYTHVEKGDVLKIGKSIFSFSKLQKPVFLGERYKDCLLLNMNSGEAIPVYKHIEGAVFESKNDTELFEVYIDEERIDFKDVCSEVQVGEVSTRYILDFNFPTSGLYDIAIYQVSGNKKTRILEKKIVYDRTLSYFVQEGTGTFCDLTLRSAFLNPEFHKTIKAEEFDLDLVRVKFGDIEYSYRVPWNVCFYKLDDEPWRHFSHSLWTEDVKLDSKLMVLGWAYTGLTLGEKQKQLEKSGIQVKTIENYKQLSIGFLKSYKETAARVTFVFKSDDNRKKKLACYSETVLDLAQTNIALHKNENSILITPVYEGKNKVYFEILDKDRALVYKSKPLRSGDTGQSDKMKVKKFYTIHFYAEKTGWNFVKPTPIFSCRLIEGRVFLGATALEGEKAIMSIFPEDDEWLRRINSHSRVSKNEEREGIEGTLSLADRNIKRSGVAIMEGMVDRKAVQVISQIQVRGGMVFYVLNEGKKKVYESKRMWFGESDFFEGFSYSTTYWFRFFEVRDSGSKSSRKLLNSVKKSFYEEPLYINDTFKITQVDVETFEFGKFVSRTVAIEDSYVKFREKVGERKFLGDVILKEGAGEIVIGSVDIELCKKVGEVGESIYITKDGDGLLYDAKNRQILRVLDDSEAPVIDKYVISWSGVKKVVRIKSY